MTHNLAYLVSHSFQYAIQTLSQAIRWCTPDGSGERLNGIQEVVGSIPIVSTKTETHTVKAVWVLFYPITPNITRTNTEFND